MTKRLVKAHLFFIVALILLCLLCVYELFFVKTYPLRYKDEILRYAEIYAVPADLVCAVINAESGYEPDAVSRAGAVGLMQLLPSTAAEIGQKLKIDDYSLLDPETNILFGVYYLSYLFGVFQNWETAVAAYNAGIGTVSLWLSDEAFSADGLTLTHIPIGETAAYVRRVAKGREKYMKKLNG